MNQNVNQDISQGINQDVNQIGELTDDRLILAALGSIPGVGSVTISEVLKCYKTPNALWQAVQKDKAVDDTVQVKEQYKSALVKGIIAMDLGKLERDLKHYRIQVIGYDDESYPAELREIFNPPQVLFYRGNLSILKNSRKIAMVGARNCTPYGRNVATVFASELATYGIAIVSGGARGVDSYAHEGALKGHGETIAVMGCGLDQSYPRSNAQLFKKILEHGGLLLSEYGPGVQPKAGFFPMRNRIIAGLAKGVIVVEARSRSGSLITADMANNEGRDVFTIPGNVLTEDFKGNHWLLNEGAILLTKASQVPEMYNWQRFVNKTEEKSSSHKGVGVLSFSLEERKILASLSNETETSLEILAMKTKLSEGALHLSLLSLELKQCIERTASKGYIILEFGRNQFVH